MGGRCCWGPWRGASTHECRRLCRSPLAGDAFACLRIWGGELPKQELSSACGSRGTSLLLVQKRSTQEKTTPRLALAGLLPGKSVSRGRAFRAGILPARKGESIHGLARCAACRPRLTAAQGTPGKAAGHPGPHSVIKLTSRNHGKASLSRGFAPVLDLALLRSARWERAALPGAPMARRVGGGKPAGWPARMPASLSSGQDALSTNPVAHPRTRRAGCPQGAPSGWPFSWVTFSLATQRESNSAAAGRRKLFAPKHFALNAARARASRTSALLQLRARQRSAAAAAKHANGAFA